MNGILRSKRVSPNRDATTVGADKREALLDLSREMQPCVTPCAK